MRVVEEPKLVWIVAGANGLELHGYCGNGRSQVEVGEAPDAVVRCSPLHWDFQFKNTEGCGRVRLGAGCSYNPLQMVEAMWTHVVAMAELDVDAQHQVHIEFDTVEVDWNPDADGFTGLNMEDWE